MRKKNKNAAVTSKFSVSDLLFKTTFGIPIFVTNLLYHTGELIIDKSIAFLSGAIQDHTSQELLSEIRAPGKKAKPSKVPTDTETIFGMRPYGPKIYIRK